MLDNKKKKYGSRVTLCFWLHHHRLEGSSKKRWLRLFFFYLYFAKYIKSSKVLTHCMICLCDFMLWTQAVGSGEPRFQSVIWGPTCDSTDKVADNYWIPELHIGDWLLVDNMGAYSVTLLTDFNGFERAQIYPVVSAATLHSARLSSTSLNT